MRLLTAFLAAAAFGLAPSAAEVSNETIRSFNEAVSGGDVDAQREAANSLAIAAMKSPDDSRAALLAFEAAWKLCELQHCEEAVKPAQFAASLPAGDEHPVATDRTLLVAFADWTAKQNRRTRSALDEALSKIVDTEPSLLSLAAFNNRFAADARRRNWGRLEKSAGEAATHLAPLKAVVGDIWATARMTEIAAGFNSGPDIEHQRAMTHLQGQLDALRIEAEQQDTELTWVKPIYNRTHAWRLTIGAQLFATDEAHLSPDEVDAILDGYGSASSTEDEDGIPLCQGDFNYAPKLRFPRESAWRGIVGSVLLGFDLVEGEVTDLAVLAAVPLEGFERDALGTARKWEWQWDEDQPVLPCKKSKEGIVLPLSFQLLPN